MNIIMVDSLLFGKGTFPEKREYIEKTAGEFRSLGVNLLLIRAEYSENEGFCLSEKNGISEVVIGVKKSKSYFKAVSRFNELLCKNAASLAGFFKPDCVIFTEDNFISFPGAFQIADASKAVLLTESFCFPKTAFGLSPWGLAFMKEQKRAQKESSAVLGFYPNAQKELRGARRFYQMEMPFSKPEFIPDKAISQKETLASFREGNTFVLAFASPCEKGFCAEEVITAFSELSDKFALVFVNFGAQKESYRRFAAEKGVTNLFFLEESAKKDLSFVLKGADGVFISENTLQKGNICEHQNFYKALAAGKPVVAAGEKNSEFFRKSGGIIITKPHQKESIALGIKTLLKMSTEDREMLGEACKNFAGKNTYRKHCEDLLALIHDLKENAK